MPYPATRLRRLRRTPGLRRLAREVRLHREDFILPLFVEEGLRRPADVPSLPGVQRHGLDSLVREAVSARLAGVAAVLLFGIPRRKDASGAGAARADGIVPRAVRLLKREVPDLVVITDVCLCAYTVHGHCGVLERLEVHNDRTLSALARVALAHARAGADLVAPSDMMDGRVGAIREALDAAGFSHVPIVSYAAKAASAFYGPFRDAAGSAPSFGDRRSYQMDPANSRQALREMALDLEEGADVLMVKPALTQLDVIARARARFDAPIWAYHVSGEYAMAHAAGKLGWLDAEEVLAESLLAVKRAGADRLITYWAKTAAKMFR